MDDLKVKALEELVKELLALVEELKTQTKKEAFDDKAFFGAIRLSLFKRLSPDQVRGIEAKLDAFKEHGYPLSWAAYALATVYHETGRKMLPVREAPTSSEAWRRRHFRYYPYYGRGDVQLTWKANYAKVDKYFGLGGRLVANPDLALGEKLSADVLVVGMKEGWFTGKKLGDYLPPDDTSPGVNKYTAARRIINGTDRAGDVASYALLFEDALRKGGYGTTDYR